jgi:hypothetical protein
MVDAPGPGADASPPGSSPFSTDSDLAAHRMRALGLRESETATPGQVVRRLLAIQSQAHQVARWSIAQRMVRPGAANDIDEAFDQGELVRTHVLRPTWHYVSPDDLRWLVRFSGPRVAARNARYWSQFGLDAAKLKASTDAIAAAVEDGPCTRPELGARLGRRGAAVGGPELAAMVLHAELHMAVCSGPMRGREHTYMAFDQRARGDGPVGDEALELLARRYFTTRGPATVHDFAWWAGLSMGEARRGLDLAGSRLEFHDQGGRRYAFAAHPERRAQRADLAIDFVQCYDEAVVSYQKSRDVLKTPRVNFEPLRQLDGFVHVILRNGQLWGHWRASRKAGSIEVRLADAASRPEHDVMATRLDALRQFLAG